MAQSMAPNEASFAPHAPMAGTSSNRVGAAVAAQVRAHLNVLPHTPSPSPSLTSASDHEPTSADDDDDDDDDDDESDIDSESEQLQLSLAAFAPALATPKANRSSMPWPYTSLDQQSPAVVDGRMSLEPIVVPASSLPHEILLQILRLLPQSSLPRALLVCKAWCQCGVELLWHKPSLTNVTALHKLLYVLIDKAPTTFPYHYFIRRLNLSPLHNDVHDLVIAPLLSCQRIERLTLAGCSHLSSESMIRFISICDRLVALDLTDAKGTDDDVVVTVARHCPKLQGLNLSGCASVTDRGVEEIALGCPSLRRMKLRNLILITDTPIILLSTMCPLLLELDLIGCTSLTSMSIQQLARTSHRLRELSLHSCFLLEDDAFPPASPTDFVSRPASPQPPIRTTNGSFVPRPTLLKYPPTLPVFEHLRYLDLTALVNMTDDAMAGIVRWMPRIRNLIIAKCTGLTDASIESLCHLGRHLHYLHMGHVSSITDYAVTKLARSCTRLRYIDVACCNLLTDMSVFELAANVPRLKRIGLVRVSNLTDAAVYALIQRPTLERIHLSYCENITVQAIHELLSHLQRLMHLSLTGVPAFRKPEIQMFCRDPPKEFNETQRASFCVFSGKGVHELRRYLRSQAVEGIIPTHFGQAQPSRYRPPSQHAHAHARIGPRQFAQADGGGQQIPIAFAQNVPNGGGGGTATWAQIPPIWRGNNHQPTHAAMFAHYAQQHLLQQQQQQQQLAERQQQLAERQQHAERQHQLRRLQAMELPGTAGPSRTVTANGQPITLGRTRRGTVTGANYMDLDEHARYDNDDGDNEESEEDRDGDSRMV